MTEVVHHDYEVSSEGAVRHWEIPYSRLTDATPTVSNPAEITSLLPGTQLTGTILSVDATNSIAVIDVTAGMVYRFEVRNVLTYNPGVAELTWGPINIGDPVYYDDSAMMPAGTYLSTSPLSGANPQVANTLFGFRVPGSDTDVAALGGAQSGSTVTCCIMQIGAGH